MLVDEWNDIQQQRVQRLISSMRRQYQAVVAAFGVFNLNSLITTGYRYIKVSLINLILALFSDDPHPITNPIIQCTKHQSHYVSMNETQNNKASIIIQDMWWKMLYWGRYWPPN